MEHENRIQHNLHLRKLALGEIDGKATGYPSIDKPWLKYYSEDSINASLPECTIYEYIRQKNGGHGNDIALMYFGKKISYSTLFQEIDKTAKAFSAIGVKSGDVVSFVAITTPELIFSLYALNKLGAVCNMIDPRMSENTISELIKKANSNVLLVLDIFSDKVEKLDIAQESKVIMLEMALSMPLHVKLGFALKEKKIPKSFKHLTWKDFVNTSNRQEESISFTYQKNWPALIEYTGGTTGEPKGVVLSNDNINSVADQYKRSGTDLSRGQSWQTVSAPFIAYALVFSMHLPLSYGMTCKIVIYDPKTIAIDTVKNEYNHIAANPLVWETIIHLPEAQNRDFSHLIAPTTGADYMSVKLENEINAFLASHGCTWKICQGYGLTEVASGISINISNECNRPGSVGVPFIDTCVSVFDAETCEELPYGSNGEICISGPSVMLGYLKNEIATNEMIKTHKDGSVWLHSGDLGHMDEDGFIFIDGRIKRMLVRYNGAKVFPPVIEKNIMTTDAVQKCVVVGKQDPENAVGQVPVAFVIIADSFTGKEDYIEKELIRICAENLPEYAQPVEYHFVENFPVTPIGKVDYRALEKKVE